MELLSGCSSPARTGVQLVAGAVLASAAVCLDIVENVAWLHTTFAQIAQRLYTHLLLQVVCS